MRDEWDMTDALIDALGLTKYAVVREGTAPAAPHRPKRKRGRPYLERIPYTPTLSGVTYDARAGRLRSRVKCVIGGTRRDVQVGQGPPTRETEERLHAAWLAKKAELEAAHDTL